MTKLKHIGIIMDGNGRWAQARGLPRSKGYAAGLEALKKIISYSVAENVEMLTVYAYSTENIKRPIEETEAIFEAVKSFCENPPDGCAVNFIGDVDSLPEQLKKSISQTESTKYSQSQIKLNIALNYGGRADIVKAVNAILESNEYKSVDEKVLSQFLSTKNLLPLDAIIRTGGEMRLSNFMLYDCAYSELAFSDTLWPDFSEGEYRAVLNKLRSRGRKFGGIVTK